MIFIEPSSRISEEMLREIPITDRGARSEKWQGIQHGVLADTIIGRATEAGLQVVDSNWFVKNDGDVLYGHVDFKYGVTIGEDPTTKDYNFSLGIRHSNCGRYALGFIVGAKILISESGFMCSEIQLNRRHTFKVVLEDVIDDGIAEYINLASEVEDKIKKLKNYKIDDRDASFVILKSHDYNLLPFRYVEHVWHEWSSPRFHTFRPRTAWSLYNAFTTVSKEMQPNRQVYLLRQLYQTIRDLLEH